MRIVIAGAGGRLGSALASELAASAHQVFAFGRTELDVTNAAQIDQVVRRVRPKAIFNCSAYNAVDAAQTDVAGAYALNGEGPANLARAAQAVGATLFHYSTDFVFDGMADQPYSEDAPTRPLSVYGASKLAGEVAVRSIGEHYILRLESLFGGTGVNGHRATVDQVAETILKGGTVRALKDRTESPSYVPEVAKVSRLLLARQGPFGTYHCVTSGFATWYELAQEVAAQLQVPANILAVTTADFQTPAARPQFCALSNKKLSDLGVAMHSWRSALTHHLTSRYIADAVTSVPARIA